MKDLQIIINDLSADERDQVADLLMLAGIRPTVFEQPSKFLYSIEIGINKANASALEGILKYTVNYIYTGESNEHIDNKH